MPKVSARVYSRYSREAITLLGSLIRRGGERGVRVECGEGDAGGDGAAAGVIAVAVPGAHTEPPPRRQP